MKFIKANIHYQNSSKSVTLSLPEFLFRGHKVIRAFVVVGLLLLVVQLAATSVYDGVLGHVLKTRIDLDKQMAQIEGTLDYLDGTSTIFFKDEQRVHSKFALTPPTRRHGNLARVVRLGRNRSWFAGRPRCLNA